MLKEHSLVLSLHGLSVWKLLLVLQKGLNTCMKRLILTSFIETLSPAMFSFLMMMLQKLPTSICQIKLLIWQHVFIPLEFWEHLVIMLLSKLLVDYLWLHFFHIYVSLCQNLFWFSNMWLWGAAYWIHCLRFLLDNLVSLSELKSSNALLLARKCSEKKRKLVCFW